MSKASEWLERVREMRKTERLCNEQRYALSNVEHVWWEKDSRGGLIAWLSISGFQFHTDINEGLDISQARSLAKWILEVTEEV